MIDGMRTNGAPAALYFLFIVIIGNYVILNLFLAILLDKFAGGVDDDVSLGPACDATEALRHVAELRQTREDAQEDSTSKAEFLLGLHVRPCVKRFDHALRCKLTSLHHAVLHHDLGCPTSPDASLCCLSSHQDHVQQLWHCVQGLLKSVLDKLLMQQRSHAKVMRNNTPRLTSEEDKGLPSNIAAAASNTIEKQECEEVLEGRSLFIFSPTNPLRKLLAWCIWQPQFEQVIIVLIFLSSITLALDSPRLEAHSDMKAILVRFPS
jgi:hypothetical protein